MQNNKNMFLGYSIFILLSILLLTCKFKCSLFFNVTITKESCN